jgi:hypothetical protein
MVKFILGRLVSAVIVLLIISAVAFVIIQIPPGDFADIYKQQLINLGGQSVEDAEIAADKLRERYGLNDPVPVQYVNWISGIVLRGEFGFSVAYKKDVGELIAQRLPRTIGIALAAHAISTIVGVALGIYIANRQYSFADNAAATFAFIATSIPRFSLALIIIYILAFGLGQEHVSAMFSPEYQLAPWSMDKVIDLIKHIWPVIFIAGFSGVARNMRGDAWQFARCPQSTVCDNSPLQRLDRTPSSSIVMRFLMHFIRLLLIKGQFCPICYRGSWKPQLCWVFRRWLRCLLPHSSIKIFISPAVSCCSMVCYLLLVTSSLILLSVFLIHVSRTVRSRDDNLWIIILWSSN